MMPFTKKMTR